MVYCSRQVSGQPEPVHPLLEATVHKHLQHPFQRPVQPYNRAAVAAIADYWQTRGKPPILLDSGCGTGAGTRKLSERFPDHLVVGIDQSQHRLAKSGVSREILHDGNCCLARADLVDCWRLMVQKKLPVAQHFILYPNPWPKKKHLQRRWHGHPVFADLVQLSPRIELRSNWKVYVDEFHQALEIAWGDGLTSAGIGRLPADDDDFLTPFEKKYALSGQPLYRLIVARNDRKMTQTHLS